MFLQLLATRLLKYVSYVTSMLAVSAVTLLRTRLILIYFVFILPCSHAIKNRDYYKARNSLNILQNDRK